MQAEAEKASPDQAKDKLEKIMPGVDNAADLPLLQAIWAMMVRGEVYRAPQPLATA